MSRAQTISREAAWREFDRWKNHQTGFSAQPHFKYSTKHCYYCGKGWGKGRQRTRQHLLPKRRGGLLETNNLRWCCYLDNQLLASVDDCPVILDIYKHLIAKSPLKYLPLKTAFLVYVAIQENKRNLTVNILVSDMVKDLKDKKKRYKAKKILSYMRKTFPTIIHNQLPKHEIPIIFKKESC